MLALEPIMQYPHDHLTEETLLDISWHKLIPEVKAGAPTLWKVFHHAAQTPKQALRNQMKDPDAVACFIIFIPLLVDHLDLLTVRSYNGLNGMLFSLAPSLQAGKTLDGIF